MAEDQTTATATATDPGTQEANGAGAGAESQPNPAEQRDQNDWNQFQQLLRREGSTQAPATDDPAASANASEGEGDGEQVSEEAESFRESGENEEVDEAGEEQAAEEGGEGQDAQQDGAEEGEQGSEPSADATPPEGFDDALAALVRDGMPEDAIKALYDKDPQNFVKYGQKRAEAQKKTDQLVGSRGNKQQREPQGGEQQAQEGEPDQGHQKAEPPKTVIDAIKTKVDDVLKPLTEGDNQEFYGDLKDPLAIGFTSMAEELAGYYEHKLQEQRQEYQSQVQQLQFQSVNNQLEMARQSLIEQYPDLKDDQTFQRVLDEHYDTLAESGKFDSVRDTFREAVKWAFSDENPANQTKKLRDEMRKRRTNRKRGTPRTRTSQPQRQEPSKEDQEFKTFQQLREQHEGAAA